MHGTGIGMLKMQRVTAIEINAPSLFVFEGDTVGGHFQYAHPVTVGDIEGGIISGDARPIARRKLAIGLLVHTQLGMRARIDFNLASVIRRQHEAVMARDIAHTIQLTALQATALGSEESRV